MSIKRETAEERKALPLASGVLDYFPDALLVVAEVSRIGNEQHHPGAPLHWDKSKSADEADALLRHLIDRGTYDTDGVRHSAKVAWRALALLQRELDAEAAYKAADTTTTVTYRGMDLSTGPDYTVERWDYDAPSNICEGCDECDPDGGVVLCDCGFTGCPGCDEPDTVTFAYVCSSCGVTHGEHVLSCPAYA